MLSHIVKLLLFWCNDMFLLMGRLGQIRPTQLVSWVCELLSLQVTWFFFLFLEMVFCNLDFRSISYIGVAVSFHSSAWPILHRIVGLRYWDCYVLFFFSFGTLLTDVVSIPKTNENFRLLYDTKGRFRLHSLRDEEAKVCL